MEWKHVDVLMVIMRIDILLRRSLATAKLLRIMSRSHDLDIETIELEIEIEIECWAIIGIGTCSWKRILQRKVLHTGVI